ncbi:MAG: hypothetical protein HYV54_01860 [Parcubacteria group bacterium]|nr:hypothetical protein [Parcubacteria group bacterium]
MIQTILLEDQEDLAEIIRDSLSDHGIEVHWYQRPSDFVRAVLRASERRGPFFKVALVDFHLYDPETMREVPFTGEDVVRMLRGFVPSMEFISIASSSPPKSFRQLVRHHLESLAFRECNSYLAGRHVARWIYELSGERWIADKVRRPVQVPSPEPVAPVTV